MRQPAAAREFYAVQQRLTAVTKAEVRRLWNRHMGDDFDGSWRRISPAILAVIAEGQAQAALAAQRLTPVILDELRIPDRPEGELVPDSLVGVASDGRGLDTLAQQSVALSKLSITRGSETGAALDEGGAWLTLMAGMQVADVARLAMGIGTASRKDVGGNVRVLNLPVCQRCAILGGRFYRWSTGFDRHPGDDCTMMPVRSAEFAADNDLTLNPQAAYRAGQIKDLTEAQIKALEAGADLSDVVNAYRGMSTTATKRGLSARQLHMREKAAKEAAEGRAASLAAGHPDLLAFARNARQSTTTARLTPEGIYQAAGDDRDEAIRLLRQWGYID